MPKKLPQQSPINLVNPIFADFGDDGLEISWKPTATGEVSTSEHGIKVVFSADSRQFVRLNQREYHLVEFHFHHPSEHWLRGEQQTMELHVVHQNIDDGTRVVVGLFIDATTKKVEVPGLVPILKSIPKGEAGSIAEISLNPLEFLPEDRSEYYRYEGSLTTPKFDENVSWAVLRHPKLLPKAEVDHLIKLFRHPARQPQARNRRYLLANFRETK